MAHYTYRTPEQLRAAISADPALDARGRAILHAALRVAEHAHAGQSRDKVDASVPYICHPIMVYEIMRRMGEMDPVVLAAALLHDALEDHSRYRANDIEMGDDLMQALFAEGITEELFDHDFTNPEHLLDDEKTAGDAYRTTNRIMRLCRGVTNPAAFDESKEIEQIERAKNMTLEEKKIKLADQAASLLCNLTMANDPAQFSIAKERNFYDKAHALGVAIIQAAHQAGERLELDAWESFFGRVLLQNQSLFDIPEGMSDAAIQTMRDHVRERFDFDHLMDSQLEVSIVPEHQVVTHYMDLHMPTGADGSVAPQIGVVRVGFDEHGRVASYIMWAAHAGGEDHEANSMQVRFTKALRERRRQFNRWMDGGEVALRGLLQPGEPINVATLEGEVRGTGRMYYVSPPLPAAAFISAARQAGACTRDDLDRIEATGAQLELAYDGRPRIPTKSIIGR